MFFGETKANTSSKISSSQHRHVKTYRNVRVIVGAAQKWTPDIRKPHGNSKVHKINSDNQPRQLTSDKEKSA